MNAAYDLIAAAARYWFIALAALILFQLICALRREARMEKKGGPADRPRRCAPGGRALAPGG